MFFHSFIKKHTLPIKWLYIIILSAGASVARASSHCATQPCVPGTICNPIRSFCFEDLVLNITIIIMQIGLPLAALMIILSGFMFIKARGKPEELTKARTMLIWVLVGTAIIIGARVIAEAVVNFAKGL